jgi:hypothetical protein
MAPHPLTPCAWTISTKSHPKPLTTAGISSAIPQTAIYGATKTSFDFVSPNCFEKPPRRQEQQRNNQLNQLLTGDSS